MTFSRASLIGIAMAGVLAFAGCQGSPTSTARQGEAPASLNGLGYGSGNAADTTTAAVSGETTAASDSTGGGSRSGLGYGSGH